MKTITKEELDKLKVLQVEVVHPVGTEDGTFAYMLLGGDCIMWDNENPASVKDRDYTVLLRNLAPSLIAAAEEGLRAQGEIKRLIDETHRWSAAERQTKLDHEQDKKDLHARVQELEEASKKLVEFVENVDDCWCEEGGSWKSNAFDGVIAMCKAALSNSTPQPQRFNLEEIQAAFVKAGSFSDHSHEKCKMVEAWVLEELEKDNV